MQQPQPFRGLETDEQKGEWARRATDTRPRIGTGFPALDELLNQGGFAPGELVLLGGRTTTRKTTVVLNIIARLLQAEVPVGVVGIDEPTPSYVAKLASVFLDLPHWHIEANWNREEVQDRLNEDYWPHTERLVLSKGYRPSFDDMTSMLDMKLGDRPRVVFIDYLALLARDKYHGGDQTRIPRLTEDLQVWTNEQQVVTIALHQVSRGDRDRAHVPMRLDHLKYGGEEFADVVLATYRPANELLGQLSREQAELEMGESFDEEKWDDARRRHQRFKDSTFLQLLKNRPGTKTEESGIELLSPTESMHMRQADNDEAVGHDRKLRAL